MKFSRRTFLQLSMMACAWAMTGCSSSPTTEQAIELTASSSPAPQAKGDEGAATPEDNRAAQTEGTLKSGIIIPDAFELPLEGATGFVGAVALPLLAEPNDSAVVLRTLLVGDMFYIRQESGNYWQVCILDGTVGWLCSDFCMINLPDVLPSVIYENPNAVASVFVTCGKSIDGITGQKLYDGLFYNPRLGREEFVMPINYSMAKKVGTVQKNALQAGDCLKIVETFRPYDVQMRVKDAVYAMANADRSLLDALNKGTWSIGWFIATSLSNHQRGVAMDATLVRIIDSCTQNIGGCPFVRVTGEEYEMPSVMHELSSAAACFTRPVASNSKTAWKNAEPAATMTDGALRLQSYCTAADLTPLASEWWHFNDLDAQSKVSATSGKGKFFLDGCVSWRMFEAS